MSRLKYVETYPLLLSGFGAYLRTSVGKTPDKLVHLSQSNRPTSDIFSSNPAQGCKKAGLQKSRYRADRFSAESLPLEVVSVLAQQHPSNQPPPRIKKMFAPSNRKRMEHGAQTPYQQSFEVLEGIDDGFFAVDQEWRFTYINSRPEQIWAGNRQRLLGKVIWEEFPQLVGSELFVQIRRAAEQQRRMQFVTQLLSGHWAEMHAYPFVGGVCVYFRLITAAEQSNAERSRLAANDEIVAAREEERQRIARELHDGAGQLLTALSIGLSMLKDTGTLDEAKRRGAALRDIADRLFNELGRVTRSLHPATVQDLGLPGALQQLVSEISQTVGVRADLAINGVEALKLNLGTQIALYRIVQEALANVRKHAHATRARVAFKFRAPTLEVTIRDNGQGFAMNDLHRNWDAHMGLRTMRERAEMLGGKLWVQSTPGSGTLVRAAIPVATG